LANFAFRDRDQAATDFIEDCLNQAQNIRKDYEPQWYENWSNYRVESLHGIGAKGSPGKQYPLADSRGAGYAISPVNFLKTPESHQGVNTLRALLLASLYGSRDYVQADPVGDEDVETSARTSRRWAMPSSSGWGRTAPGGRTSRNWSLAACRCPTPTRASHC
jgi:hypothetical protein